MTNTLQKNWAGNITYQAEMWHSPTTTDAVQTIVQDNPQIKVLGSRHSFNQIADSEKVMLSLAKMNQVIELNTNNMTVTIQAGMTYGDLGKYLQDKGYALANLASLPHISVVGAIMTGTHGSGEGNGNLATSVSGLEFVTGTGDIIHVSRDGQGEQFDGMVVSLGALGIVTQITLDIVPSFDVRQDVYLNLPMDEVFANFDAIQASAYSVSLFTKWEDNLIAQAWMKSRVDVPFMLDEHFYGGQLATVPCSPVGDDLTARCTEQLGMAGAWIDRLPHFRMEFTPSHGDEIQSEYFVPRDRAVEAIQAVNALHREITPLLHITEIRSIKADALWMSPAYGRDSVALHFTWKPLGNQLNPVLKHIESALQPFGVRPHWGKVFHIQPTDVQAQYERLSDFQALRERYDPQGKFMNRFLGDFLM